MDVSAFCCSPRVVDFLAVAPALPVPNQGACRVLSVFWEMVPIDTTRALLTRVVGRLASDGASPLVRLAAVEGLTLLLECPASHSVLKSMLPVSEEGGSQRGRHQTSSSGCRLGCAMLMMIAMAVRT